MIRQLISWFVSMTYEELHPSAKVEGDQAYQDGKSPESNPYPEHSSDHIKWLNGYLGK
jgi:ribosome modulation factor